MRLIPDGSPFGLDNLPYGVFSVGGGPARVGVRVGDSVIDLAAALGDEVFAAPSLNPFMATGPASWARRAGADHRAGRGRRGAGRCGAPAGRRRADAAVRGRRLRGLLRLRGARVQPRTAVPAGQPRAAAAELEAPAGRLPRPGGHGRGLGHRHRPPHRAAQGARRPGAGVRPVRPARHRGGARVRGRRRVAAGRAGHHGRLRRPRVRRRPRQRLVRPRPAGLGVRAARAAPGQVVRDLGLGLGDAAGGAGRRAGAVAGPAPAGAARTCARTRTGAWTSTWRSSGMARWSPARRTRRCTGRRPRCWRT